MAAKKTTPKTTPSTNLPALTIGTRIRCTEDGVEGRITWVNGLFVKVQWADGEQITWRRDALASKPIEILDVDGEDEQPATAAVAAETATPAEAAQPEVPAAAEIAPAAAAISAMEQPAPTAAAVAAEPTTTEQPHAESKTTPVTTELPATEPATLAPATAAAEPTPATATAPDAMKGGRQSVRRPVVVHTLDEQMHDARLLAGCQ